MSFYFHIHTEHRPTEDEIITALPRDDVEFLTGDDGSSIFFIPGTSLRGVVLYPDKCGYEVGLNAFTPHDDAVLTHDLVIAVAKLTNGTVTPESEETPLASEELHGYFTDDWFADRATEADILVSAQEDTPADSPIVVFGYRRPFGVSRIVVQSLMSQGMNKAQVLDELYRQGAAIQELDQTQDIFVPTVLEITPPNPRKGFFGRFLSKERSIEHEKIAAFVVPPEIRMLTPLNPSQLPFFAILGDESLGHRIAPVETLYAEARAMNADEYGAHSFDLRLNEDAYDRLYQASVTL